MAMAIAMAMEHRIREGGERMTDSIDDVDGYDGDDQIDFCEIDCLRAALAAKDAEIERLKKEGNNLVALAEGKRLMHEDAEAELVVVKKDIAELRGLCVNVAHRLPDFVGSGEMRKELYKAGREGVGDGS